MADAADALRGGARRHAEGVCALFEVSGRRGDPHRQRARSSPAANIENASYPEGWCAETSAIAHMVMAGERRIAEVAVVAEKMPRITPCGGCRQRLNEFGTADTLVHLCDATGIVETVTLGDLLPKAFEFA